MSANLNWAKSRFLVVQSRDHLRLNNNISFLPFFKFIRFGSVYSKDSESGQCPMLPSHVSVSATYLPTYVGFEARDFPRYHLSSLLFPSTSGSDEESKSRGRSSCMIRDAVIYSNCSYVCKCELSTPRLKYSWTRPSESRASLCHDRQLLGQDTRATAIRGPPIGEPFPEELRLPTASKMLLE